MSITEKPKFVGGKPRDKLVELDYPLEFRGKLYSSLTVRRLSVSEVADWAAKVNAGEQSTNLGNVVDDAGEVVPLEVLESLDDDDDIKLSEVIQDFLPRRLAGASESQ